MNATLPCCETRSTTVFVTGGVVNESRARRPPPGPGEEEPIADQVGLEVRADVRAGAVEGDFLEAP